MRQNLLHYLRCPQCRSRLSLSKAIVANWIEQGQLLCTQCQHTYAITKGIAYLYVENEEWKQLAAEAAGWVQMAKDAGCYDQTGIDIDFRLPYVPIPPWIDIARAFDIVLNIVRPQPGAMVVDIGAGRGWAAKQFAIRGCHAVAVEINDDDQIGLGRSIALMQHANVQYDLLIANSQRLPLADESFDIVFASAALHHSSSLEILLSEAARVLRRRGKLIAIHEPCIADHVTPEQYAPDIAQETAYNIHESRPKLDDYRHALRQAGLRELALFNHELYGASIEDMQQWAANYRLSLLTADQIAMLRRRRTPTLWQIIRVLLSRLQQLPDTTLVPPQDWMDQYYRHIGGSLTVIAQKP